MQTPVTPSASKNSGASVSGDGPRSGISTRAWVVVFLCGLAGMLFYMDRQTLSVLKTTLKGEMGWTDTDYSHLVSAFMACYTACYLFTGRWIDRWGTRMCMPLFLGLMSGAMILSGVATGLGMMAASRALLGLAEAGVMPTIMVAIYAWFPQEHRGVASTVKEPMYVVGQIAALPLAVLLTKYWNWHSAFFVPGIFGLAVAAMWWFADKRRTSAAGVGARGCADVNMPVVPAVRYRDALKRKELWGVIAARLVSDPLWFFFLYWEPGYLQERLGMSLDELAKIGWIPTAVATATLIVLGFASDRFVMKLNWQPARSRRVILQTLAALAPVLIVLPYVHDHALVIILLCVVRVMMVVWLNFTNLLMADLVPSNLIGTSIALMSAFGAATGLLCNAIVGPVLDKIGYGVVFAVGACLHPLAAFILWWCYGRKRRFATSEK